MSNYTAPQNLILATGMQSGGTTLVSWCFLQNPLLDGMLDMASDRIQVDFQRVQTPWVWVKMTNYSFRWSEVAEIYSLYGFNVKPLLIVRDPYRSYASLKYKWYGRNSLTAEDPPLILRFRRFFEDWQIFIDNNWPIIQFEQFLEAPESELRRVCAELELNYSDDMLDWPKPIDELAYVSQPNHTFSEQLNKTKGALKLTSAGLEPVALTLEEVSWIEHELAPLLKQYNYDRPALLAATGRIKPHPFDGRRYIGYGSQPRLKPFSEVLALIIEELKKIEFNQLFIYGAGEVGDYVFHEVHSTGLVVSALLDKNEALHGKHHANIEIKPIEAVSLSNGDVIIIAVLQSINEIRDNIFKVVGDLNITCFSLSE